ncbi:hypothetical protein ACJIZ3_004506 [Penstemon smallii]|uniref:Uncharacterized protein n=1 Tax=Penstemon smallii TaxID=265156 RepID=A0ABD3S296_9LAMI
MYLLILPALFITDFIHFFTYFTSQSRARFINCL